MTDPLDDPRLEVPLEDLAEQRAGLGDDGDDEVARAASGPGPVPVEADEGDVLEQSLDLSGDEDDYPRDA